jgi:hypothetical protein
LLILDRRCIGDLKSNGAPPISAQDFAPVMADKSFLFSNVKNPPIVRTPRRNQLIPYSPAASVTAV